MKKTISVIFLSLIFLLSNAQNYQISFAGTGGSTTVNTVHIENLTQGTSLTIDGTDILQLLGEVGINQTASSLTNTLSIYPNPMTETSYFEFESASPGMSTVTVSDVTGKQVCRTQTFLNYGRHLFAITELKCGVYLVDINSEAYHYTGKLICQGTGIGNGKIFNVSGKVQSTLQNGLKSAKSLVPMQYNEGDLLLFTCISGTYSTVTTLIPTQSTTVTSNFIASTDADGNNYPTVTIGAQVWMAENLKTTHYSNGDELPEIADSAAWIALTNGAYCWYENDIANKPVYGALYNWYTVADSRNVCPLGWHTPTDAEWVTLVINLGGETVAGGKIKETGTIHWAEPNTGATNETGFTGRPAGLRYSDGTFISIGGNGYFWTTTEISSTKSQCYVLNSNQAAVFYYSKDKIRGHSVRCIKD